MQSDVFNSFDNQITDLNDIDSENEIEEEDKSNEGNDLGESMRTDKHNVPMRSPEKSNFDRAESVEPTSNQYKVSFQGSVEPYINEIGDVPLR